MYGHGLDVFCVVFLDADFWREENEQECRLMSVRCLLSVAYCYILKKCEFTWANVTPHILVLFSYA